MLLVIARSVQINSFLFSRVSLNLLKQTSIYLSDFLEN